MPEVKVGDKVHVKQHLGIDAVGYGPGRDYEVVEDKDAEPGNNLTVAQAKRATRRQANAEVLEPKSGKEKS